MCVVYLAWESNIDVERLEKALQWHHVTVVKPTMQQGNLSLMEIGSENLLRRNLCCFGRHRIVYAPPKSLQQYMEELQINTSMSDAQREEVANAHFINAAYRKRWQRFDAEWWLACMKTLVDEFENMGIFYTFGEELEEFTTVLSKPKQTVCIQDMSADTLFYLPERTILEVTKTRVQ